MGTQIGVTNSLRYGGGRDVRSDLCWGVGLVSIVGTWSCSLGGGSSCTSGVAAGMGGVSVGLGGTEPIDGSELRSGGY